MKHKEPKTLCTDERGTLYEDFEEMLPKKTDVFLAILFALVITVFIVCVVIAAVRERVSVSKENKIEQAIIEELKLQATDYGADGDEYVIYLFPAVAEKNEVADEGGRFYLAYIIGSGTDDEGEWQLVKYEPNGNIRTYDIP